MDSTLIQLKQNFRYTRVTNESILIRKNAISYDMTTLS